MEVRATAVPRVALYGGSFDPVHNAHLKVAQCAMDQAGMDKVIFIPSAQAPLKAHAPKAGDADRLRMLELATAHEARFEVDPCEYARGGVSYTLDTVQHFEACAPQAHFFWILGADQLEQLERWDRIEALARRVTFLVVARPGYTLRRPAVAGLRFIELAAPLMGESSSEVRRRCAEGGELSGMVSPAVEAFISARGLYTDAH